MRKTTLNQVFACCLMLCGFLASAQTISSSEDDGAPGTLRSQVMMATAGETLTFAADVTSISLTQGPILIDKSLTISGLSSMHTNIDAGAMGRHFTITSGTLTLNNLILQNGVDSDGGSLFITDAVVVANEVQFNNNTANGASGSGGAIYLGSNSTLTLNDCTLSNNISNRAGGAIETVAGTTLMLSDTNLLNNKTGIAPAVAAPGNGGAIHITGAGNAEISGGIISMNMAANEGGGLWNGTGIMTIEDADIVNNEAMGANATNGGGGIFNLGGGTLLISDVLIQNNMATGASGSGGGILSLVGSTLEIEDSTISGNTSNRAGGGIEANGVGGTTTVDLDNVNLDNNTTMNAPGNGGGLHITGPGSINITGGTVNGNTAGREGGGLWNDSGTMIIINTEINENTALGVAADDGGAGIFNNNGGSVLINNSTISGNMATGTSASGGGILSLSGSIFIENSTFNDNAANRAGGAIEIVNGILTLTNTDLLNNDVNGIAGTPSPGNGGGIHLSGISTTTINGGIIAGNKAGREGGGLWNQTGSLMTVNQVNINNNQAYGTETTHGGGGIFNNGGDLILTGSTVYENATFGALANGGGIHIKSGSATLLLNTISGNTTLNLGGGFYNNAIANINATTIANNSASQGGGLANNSAEAVSLKNSLIANNDADMQADIYSMQTPNISEGFNLISKSEAASFSSLETDLFGSDEMPLNAQLDVLADNGGLLLTHKLLGNSPAFNAGNPMDLFDDQLGNPVFDGRRDIGAVESQSVLSQDIFTTQNPAMILYPNPARNVVSLQLQSIDTNGQLTIIALSTGQIVNQYKITEQTSIVSLNNLSQGVYVLQYQTTNTTTQEKLVVE
uniref:choice-of-anchor Q domain-containing protein n=1 Tax=Flavobacterium sp. TaxID=239 RepID=UPI00404B4475